MAISRPPGPGRCRRLQRGSKARPWCRLDARLSAKFRLQGSADRRIWGIQLNLVISEEAAVTVRSQPGFRHLRLLPAKKPCKRTSNNRHRAAGFSLCGVEARHISQSLNGTGDPPAGRPPAKRLVAISGWKEWRRLAEMKLAERPNGTYYPLSRSTSTQSCLNKPP